MCLEPSTYATMALREITKEDTSASTHASISVGVTSDPSASLVQDVTCSSNDPVIDPKSEADILDIESAESTQEKDGPQTEFPSIETEKLLNESRESDTSITQNIEDMPDHKRDGLKRKAATSSDEVTSEKKTKDL